MMYRFRNYKLTFLESSLLCVGTFLNQSEFRGSWRLQKLLSHRLLPSRDVLCDTAYGFQLILNPQADPYQSAIFRNGTYEPATLAFMERILRPGDVFVDVGANIGLMSLTAARCVGDAGAVYAFEPSPKMYQRLLENVELNEVMNVTAVRSAVGAVDEERSVFAYPDVNIGHASLVESEGAIPAGQVDVITLDSFIEEKKLGKIRMIKVDVEGFEYEVIAGAEKYLSGQNAPFLCVECDELMPRDTGSGSMAEIHALILGTKNYEAYKFAGSKFDKNCGICPLSDLAEIRQHDNIIYVPTGSKHELDLEALG